LRAQEPGAGTPALQSGLAAVTAILVGAIGGETALPMATIIALYGLLAVTASRRLSS
jgi:hypothetical protein